jgi:cysteinyl-tRNA synthetase
LDTPLALSVIDETFTKVKDGIQLKVLDAFTGFLQTVDDLLGLTLLHTPNLSAEQATVVSKRHEAKLAKDFTTADSLRDQLASQGISVRDTPRGPLWSWL